MDHRNNSRIAGLAARVVTESMASDMSWDEAIIALGVAAKSMAANAARAGSGSEADCVAHAQQRFQEGMDNTADILRPLLR